MKTKKVKKSSKSTGRRKTSKRPLATGRNGLTVLSVYARIHEVYKGGYYIVRSDDKVLFRLSTSAGTESAFKRHEVESGKAVDGDPLWTTKKLPVREARQVIAECENWDRDLTDEW